MTKKYIPKALRELVIKRARGRCEYCQTQAEPTAMPIEIDHIIPRAMQGLTEEDNLCLACTYCNDSKNKKVFASDPDSRETVMLFNPRKQIWSEHFAWTKEADKIIGLTPIGRTTVAALKLNRPELVRGRKRWVKAGWHPPKD